MNWDLDRFLQAHQGTYDTALREVQQGGKRTHWMWFIFPILDGLGHSSTAHYYGLTSTEEAYAYYRHPVLGPRLVEIASATLLHTDKTAQDIFGSTDAWKLHCCMTLFRYVAQEEPVFQQVLDRYFSGRPEPRTDSRL